MVRAVSAGHHPTLGTSAPARPGSPGQSSLDAATSGSTIACGADIRLDDRGRALDGILHVEGVAKVYPPPPPWLRPVIRVGARHPVPALEGIDLDVHAGEIVGLVGPNGAGKTTLIKIIASLLAPSSGRVTIDGHDVLRARERACAQLGLVLEGDRGLYSRINGMQNLEFFGAMAGLPRAEASQRARELMAVLELSSRDKLVFAYSAGMRMRLSLARALMGDPALVVLDEPTRSLDPLASRLTGRLLRQLAQEGHAILLSNHRLDEVVTICDRIVVIINGQLRYEGTPAELATTLDGAATALGDLLEREAAGSAGPS